METVLIYFLKVNFLLTVFAFSYWLLLRKGKLLQLNRLILLIGIVLTFLLPGLPTNAFMESPIAAPVKEIGSRASAVLPSIDLLSGNNLAGISQIVTGSTGNSPSSEVFPLLIFLGIITGVIILMLLLIKQVSHIFNLILYSTNTREGRLTIVHTSEDIPPFSFFHFLVINPSNYGEEDLQRIIVHEKVHIHQHHYIDILVGELLRIVCWYNPLAWLLNNLLKINLEYIADREVLNDGIDRKDYQYQLLQMSLEGQSLRLVTPLNYSPIKMRIAMMNSKKSSLLLQARYLLLLPVMFFSLVMITPVQAQETVTINGTVGPTTTSSATTLSGAVGERTNTSATTLTGTVGKLSKLKKRDLIFVIRPETTRKTLDSVLESLAEQGVTVNYTNIEYEGDRLKAISMTITTATYSGSHSHTPVDDLLVFYDFQLGDKKTGFEYGVPDFFTAKQRKNANSISGLLIRHSN